MSTFDALLATFDEHFATFETSAPVRFMGSPAFAPHHYASALREIYFYTRDNPQLQCAMTLGFRGSRRTAVRRIVGHALDEVGHDALALNDLAALGHDVSRIPGEEPLPSTLPLIAHPVYVLQQRNPVGYLGQIFFLEFMPTRSGARYLAALAAAGVPEEATTFLAEHAEVDEHHNRIMRKHVADLVLDEDDLRECQLAIRNCAYLYAQMLQGAFDSADRFALEGACGTGGSGHVG